jgi:hypothetical protein
MTLNLPGSAMHDDPDAAAELNPELRRHVDGFPAVDPCPVARVSPASGLLQADGTADVGARLRANS